MFGKNDQPSTSADTRTFPSVSDRDATIRQILGVVYEALEEKGYNPVSQIVGYILSEDPAYITNYKNSRTLITKFDRDELLDAITRYYFKKTE